MEDFIRDELASLGVTDEGWDLLDEPGLQRALDADKGAAVLARDDFIIGLAFSQLLTEGRLDPKVRQRALIALRRQATSAVLSFRGGGGEEERRGQLRQFEQILDSVLV